MSLHQEPGLERRRGQQHSTLECCMEEPSEQTLIEAGDVVPARDGLDSEKYPNHAADMGHDAGETGGCKGSTESLGDQLAGVVETVIKIRVGHQLTEGGKTCRRHQRVAGECSCLVDGAVGGDYPHQLGSSPVGGGGGA